MEQNSMTNSSNAGANLRKEDIHQMIDGRRGSETLWLSVFKGGEYPAFSIFSF
jgi:hypothetical protein